MPPSSLSLVLMLIMLALGQQCLGASLSGGINCHNCDGDDLNCKSDRSCAGLACLTVVSINGSHMKVNKGCITNRKHSFKEECAVQKMANTTVSVCYCFKDYCNVANPVTFEPVIMAFCYIAWLLLRAN